MDKQPMPIPRPDLDPIADLVIQDVLERKRIGIKTYGTLLTAFNGRDALQDAYEECLDMANYIKQHIVEKQYLDGDCRNLFDDWLRNSAVRADASTKLLLSKCWVAAWNAKP